jgi:hypothetical protein
MERSHKSWDDSRDPGSTPASLAEPWILEASKALARVQKTLAQTQDVTWWTYAILSEILRGGRGKLPQSYGKHRAAAILSAIKAGQVSGWLFRAVGRQSVYVHEDLLDVLPLALRAQFSEEDRAKTEALATTQRARELVEAALVDYRRAQAAMLGKALPLDKPGALKQIVRPYVDHLTALLSSGRLTLPPLLDWDRWSRDHAPPPPYPEVETLAAAAVTEKSKRSTIRRVEPLTGPTTAQTAPTNIEERAAEATEKFGDGLQALNLTYQRYANTLEARIGWNYADLAFRWLLELQSYLALGR